PRAAKPAPPWIGARTPAAPALAPRGEEGAEHLGALLAEQAAGHGGAMVEARLAEDIEEAPAGSRLGAVGGIEHTRNPGQHDRARAHGAGLELDVDDRVEHAPAADGPRSLAQGDDLGVGRGILAQLALVVPACENLSVAHHDLADRHVVVFQRTLGLA